MLIVAGLTLKNLKPRVWDPESKFYIPTLRAVMVSYAELHTNATLRKRARTTGLRSLLGVPDQTRVFLDNGAFHFLRSGVRTDCAAYRRFVRGARPDWYPVPFDAIPTPTMSLREQHRCFSETMRVNARHYRAPYVPVVHVGRLLERYVAAVLRSTTLRRKQAVALGGIVPNLLRSPRAVPCDRVLEYLVRARRAFGNKLLHVFGLGGTATIHLAGLLGVSSADSSGWRNRAARGIVQLPGHGDRRVADLGSWSGREPSRVEWGLLARCQCPACAREGVRGLKARGIIGFCNRATHNLHVLLDEAAWVEARLKDGTYTLHFRQRLNNSIYRPIVERFVNRTELTSLRRSGLQFMG